MNLLTKTTLVAALGATLLTAPLAQAGDHGRTMNRDSYAPVAQATDAVMLVRVRSLTGIGPDGARHTIYRSDEGVLTPVDEVGRLGAMAGATQPAGDGAYYNLQAELAPEFSVASQSSGTQHSQFNATGASVPLDLSGALLVMNGTARPLGIAPYYLAYGAKARSTAAYRNDYRRDGQRWEDGEDDD